MEKRIELTDYEIYEAKSTAVFNALCKKFGVEPNLMKLRAVIVGSDGLKFKELLPSKKSSVDKVVEEFNKVYNDDMLKGVTDEVLLEFISTLSERQQEVIKKRFSLVECSYDPTLENVANELGLKREQIRGIEAKSLRTLRLRLIKKRHSEEYWKDVEESQTV